MRHWLKGTDYLAIKDFDREKMSFFLETAMELKRRWCYGDCPEVLKGKIWAALFEKKSTRTRNSFQSAVHSLGGGSIYLRPDELQLSRGEPIKDTARMIDRYYDGLFIRTFGHEIVQEFSHYMKNPVINGLTSLEHPTQALADMMTIVEKKGGLHKGIKICYAGDIFNVCHSLMIISAMYGMEIHVCQPDGYPAEEVIVNRCKELCESSGGKVVFTKDYDSALKDADIVYGNTWHSMGAAELETEKRIKDFGPFQINMAAMKKAKKDAIFMHCLPGYRGEDMTDEVIESDCSAVWDQGANRMHSIRGIVALVTP